MKMRRGEKEKEEEEERECLVILRDAILRLERRELEGRR